MIIVSYFSVTTLVISVAMTPGRTSFTRIPSGARRSANSVVSMETAAFEPQYSPLDVDETSAEQEPTFTICPLLLKICSCFIICFAASWVRNMVPFVLIPKTRSKLSSDISNRSFLSFGATPALFTRISILPNFSTVSLIRRSLSSLQSNDPLT